MIKTRWSLQAEKMLFSAAGSKHDLDLIKNDIRNGLSDLWRFDQEKINGYIVTRGERLKNKKLELVIVLGAGRGANEFVPKIIGIAKNYGFDSIRAHNSRIGLNRIYLKNGFKIVEIDNDGQTVVRRCLNGW